MTQEMQQYVWQTIKNHLNDIIRENGVHIEQF